jgi:hypothetical protein
MRVGVYVFAALLLSLPAMQASFAADGHGRAAGTVRYGKRGFRLAAPEKLPARRPPAPGASDFAPRNAIGMPVESHEVIRGGNGGPSSRSAVQSPAGGTGGAGSVFDANRSNGGTRIVAPNLTPTRAASGRGRIDGAGVIRPGFAAPGGIGGPTKGLTGISGTTIRPKH